MNSSELQCSRSKLIVASIALTIVAGCRFERSNAHEGSLERRLIHESWSSFTEMFSPERGHRIAFLPFNVVVRESGQMSETWEMIGDDVLELTTGTGRRFRYRWFESIGIFAFCREGFRQPFFVAPDSMTASDVFEAAGMDGLRFCNATALLRISGARIRLSGQPVGRVELADLEGVDMTRRERAAVRNLGVIDTLILSRTNVTDVDLSYLAGLSSLTNLALDNTAVSDLGMKYLVGLPLKRIDLRSTQLTDQGIMILADVSTLESLNVEHTAVTSIGIDSLRRRLPGIVIRK